MSKKSCIIRIDFTQRFLILVGDQKTDKEIYYQLCHSEGELWANYANFVTWRCTFGEKKNINLKKIEFLNKFLTISNQQENLSTIFYKLYNTYKGSAPWKDYNTFLKYKSLVIKKGIVNPQ